MIEVFYFVFGLFLATYVAITLDLNDAFNENEKEAWYTIIMLILLIALVVLAISLPE
jgi:hypothetical protein